MYFDQILAFFAQKIMSKLSFQNWFSENDPFLKMAKTPTNKSKPIIFFGSECLLGHFLLILGADKKIEMQSGWGV